MAAPLKDLKFDRVGLSESTHMWLESDAEAFDTSMQEIARRVLDEWAAKKAHAFRIAAKRLRANGLQMELLGNDAEDNGTPRSARK